MFDQFHSFVVFVYFRADSEDDYWNTQEEEEKSVRGMEKKQSYVRLIEVDSMGRQRRRYCKSRGRGSYRASVDKPGFKEMLLNSLIGLLFYTIVFVIWQIF